MSKHENRDRPVLLRVVMPGWPPVEYHCHATGETGDCGHPLAECPDPGCPGSMCPTCGAWRCASCEGLSARFHEVLAEGAALADERVARLFDVPVDLLEDTPPLEVAVARWQDRAAREVTVDIERTGRWWYQVVISEQGAPGTAGWIGMEVARRSVLGARRAERVAARLVRRHRRRLESRVDEWLREAA